MISVSLSCRYTACFIKLTILKKANYINFFIILKVSLLHCKHVSIIRSGHHVNGLNTNHFLNSFCYCHWEYFSGDIPRNASNPWQIRNDQNVNTQGLYQGSTTPWPSLGQRKSQLQNAFQQGSPQNNFQSSNNRQPTWVRENNSPYWVRNTPVPNQPVTPNYQYQGSIQTGDTGINNQNTGTRWGSETIGQNPSRPWYGNGRNVYYPTTSTSAPGSFLGSRGNSPNPYQGVVQSGDVTDDELREFSEELLKKDTNNAAKYVTINVQGMTSSRSSRDEAPEP